MLTRTKVGAAATVVVCLGFISQAPAQAPAPPEIVVEPGAGGQTADTPPVPDFGGPLGTRSKLTGDWFGVRNDLRDDGVTFDLSSTLYYQGAASGGLRDTFRFGGRNDYLMNVDGEKAGLWQGLFLDLHGETVYGESVNRDTGTLMPVNIGRLFPIPDGSTTALTGVRVTQALSEHFALFAGKINTFDDARQPFLPGRGLDAGFMNTAMVFNGVMARTVPYSTLGAGAAFLVDRQPAAVVMVLDTNNAPTTSGFHTFFDNGATILAQGGLPVNLFARPGLVILGGTYSSGRYAETGTDAYTLVSNLAQGLPAVGQKSGSWCIYGTAQQPLWTDPCDQARSWGVFGNLGISDGNPNPIRWTGSAGVAGSSPIPGRKLDTFGLAYFYVGLSDSFKNIAPRLLPLRDERGVELFYDAGVTPWCHITPDLQVVTPARARVDSSLVLGLRAKIDW